MRSIQLVHSSGGIYLATGAFLCAHMQQCPEAHVLSHPGGSKLCPRRHQTDQAGIIARLTERGTAAAAHELAMQCSDRIQQGDLGRDPRTIYLFITSSLLHTSTPVFSTRSSACMCGGGLREQ